MTDVSLSPRWMSCLNNPPNARPLGCVTKPSTGWKMSGTASVGAWNVSNCVGPPPNQTHITDLSCNGASANDRSEKVRLEPMTPAFRNVLRCIEKSPFRWVYNILHLILRSMTFDDFCC